MAKPSTFPTLYNEALQIPIQKLKSWGCLNSNQIKTGVLNWDKNGNLQASILIRVNTQSEQPYVELSYEYKNEPRTYKVYLTSTPSNLNKGEIWYFICPHTGRRCLKLYLVRGYFLHRQAFTGCMYASQVLSKRDRLLYKMREAFCAPEHKRHAKDSYKGKPTKRHLRLVKRARQAEALAANYLRTLEQMVNRMLK